MPTETLRKLVNTVTRYGLPLPALAAFTLGGPPWLGHLVGLGTLCYLLWRYGPDNLARHRLTRSLLVVAVLIGLAADAALSVPLAVAGIVLVAIVSGEPMLAKALASGRMTTANLAVARGRAERMWDPRWPYLGHVGLLVLFGGTAGFGLPIWPLATGIAAALGLALAAVLYAWRQRRTAHGFQHDAAVWQALLRLQPRFAVHFSAPAGTEFHVGTWLPYLERLGLPYLVILREERCLEGMARLTDAPIVLAPSMGHLEHVVPPSLRTVFYVNNGMKNVQMVRIMELTHIQLLHGDSDKTSSYNPVTAMFDKIFVAGQAGIDRYRDNNVLIPREKFSIVGRPQVSGVEISRKPIAEAVPPTVLYAPTWTGWFTTANYCSLPIGVTIVRGLLERGATVILRAHPYTTRVPAAARHLARVERVLAEHAARTGRQHRWGRVTSLEMSLIECMNAADAMVSDVTAVASDWLYSEKPFAITDMLDEGERFAETFPLSAAGYVIDSAARNLPDVLDRLLDTDPLADLRRRVKTYYLGDFPDATYVDAFLDEARRCVLGADPARSTAA